MVPSNPNSSVILGEGSVLSAAPPRWNSAEGSGGASGRFQCPEGSGRLSAVLAVATAVAAAVEGCASSPAPVLWL